MTELDAKTKQQIKVYSRWFSNKLKNSSTCKVNDITTDLSDGIALIELAEILTKKKADPTCFKNPAKFSFQKVQNCDYAIKMFEANGISFNGTISGADITEKNIQQTLYLVWMLILNYSIDPAVREDQNFQFSKDNKNTDSKNIASRNKIQLLTWATDKIKNYPNIQDKFQPYDLSMCALINEYYPKEINYNTLDANDRDANLQLANDAMEKLQIPVLLTPEDLKCCDYNVDGDCLMTQLSALKSSLDKKFPKRKSLVGRQNNTFARPKITQTQDENIQTDAIHHTKPRNIPTGKNQKKVRINRASCALPSGANKEDESDNIDLKKVKFESKSASLFPVKLDTDRKKKKKVNAEIKNDEFKPEINNSDISPSSNNSKLQLDSRDIYSQPQTKNTQRMQIETTNFEIEPDSDYKSGKNKISNSKRNVETRDFGIQPDSDDIKRNQISASSSGTNIGKKKKALTRDFGIQPDSENSGNNINNDTNNDQIQKREVDVNLDISIGSSQNSYDKLPNILKKSKKKTNQSIQTESKNSETDSEARKTSTKNKPKKLQISGKEENHFISNDSGKNGSNDQNNQIQTRGIELQIEEEEEGSNDKENIIPTENKVTNKRKSRRRRSELKSTEKRSKKLNSKRRNTYFGNSPSKRLDDNNSNRQSNIDEFNLDTEEEEEIDNQSNHSTTPVSTETDNTNQNRTSIQTRNIKLGFSADQEESTNEEPQITSKIPENNKNNNNNNYISRNSSKKFDNKPSENENDNEYEDENEDETPIQSSDLELNNHESGKRKSEIKNTEKKHSKQLIRRKIHTNSKSIKPSNNNNLQNQHIVNNNEEETESENRKIKQNQVPRTGNKNGDNKVKTRSFEIQQDDDISDEQPPSTTKNPEKKHNKKDRHTNMNNFEIVFSEEEKDSGGNDSDGQIHSRNPANNKQTIKTNQTNEIDTQTDQNSKSLLETRDVGIQSPKSHRRKRNNSLESVNENSSSAAPKTLRIKVNGNIDRSIVITVRNFSHKRNESAHSSRKHTHSTLNSPVNRSSNKNSPSMYRSHTPHKSHSHYPSNPTSYSMPNTPTVKCNKECSIVPVFNEDGNKSPSTRKFLVHVKDDDLKVKKKFSDSVSGIRITLNDNQDNDSQKEEQNVDN